MIDGKGSWSYILPAPDATKAETEQVTDVENQADLKDQIETVGEESKNAADIPSDKGSRRVSRGRRRSSVEGKECAAAVVRHNALAAESEAELAAELAVESNETPTALSIPSPTALSPLPPIAAQPSSPLPPLELVATSPKTQLP